METKFLHVQRLERPGVAVPILLPVHRIELVEVPLQHERPHEQVKITYWVGEGLRSDFFRHNFQEIVDRMAEAKITV